MYRIKQFLKSANSFLVVMMIFGICLAVFPEFIIATLCYILGALAIAFAVLRFIEIISSPVSFFGIGSCVVMFIFGILLISNHTGIVSILPLATGIYLLVDGIAKLKHALDYRSGGSRGWQAIAFFAVCSILTGIILLIFPFETVNFVLRVIGVILIIKSIEGFINMFYVRKMIDKSSPIETTFTDSDNK